MPFARRSFEPEGLAVYALNTISKNVANHPHCDDPMSQLMTWGPVGKLGRQTEQERRCIVAIESYKRYEESQHAKQASEQPGLMSSPVSSFWKVKRLELG